jgi:hypothetical protein
VLAADHSPDCFERTKVDSSAIASASRFVANTNAATRNEILRDDRMLFIRNTRLEF